MEEKIRESYEKMKQHVASHESWESFQEFFTKVMEEQGEERVSTWLLIVLFVKLKEKHPFDELLGEVDETKRVELGKWLESSLEKARSE